MYICQILFQDAVWEIYVPVKYRKELEAECPFSWIHLITIFNNIISVIFYLDKEITNVFIYQRYNFLYFCLNKYGQKSCSLPLKLGEKIGELLFDKFSMASIEICKR